MTAPETPAAPAPTPADAEAEAARLRARDTYRKQAAWRGRFNPLLGRARPDYAPGETFTAPAVPLDPPPAGVKSMSGFERYCEPPKPPPRILRPREAPPPLPNTELDGARRIFQFRRERRDGAHLVAVAVRGGFQRPLDDRLARLAGLDRGDGVGAVPS